MLTELTIFGLQNNFFIVEYNNTEIVYLSKAIDSRGFIWEIQEATEEKIVYTSIPQKNKNEAILSVIKRSLVSI